MKIYKQAILIPKDQDFIEILSFYNKSSKKYGIEAYNGNKLIETVYPLDEEPLKDQMRLIGTRILMNENKNLEALE